MHAHTTVAVIRRTLVRYMYVKEFRVVGGEGGIYKYEAWTKGRILGTRVFFLAIHSHLYQKILLPPPPPLLSKSCLKLVCNVNIVY